MKQWRHVHGRLADIGFGALVLLGLVAAALGVDYHGQRLEREALDTRRQLTAIDARQFEDHFTQTLNAVGLALQHLDAGIHRFAPGEWNSVLADTLWQAPHLRSLSLMDDAGVVVASSNPNNIGMRTTNDGYLPAPDPGIEVLRIGPVHAGRDLRDGTPVAETDAFPDLAFIPVTRRMHGGKGPFTLLAALNVDYFLNHISARLDGAEHWVDVLDYEGRLLLSNRGDANGAGIRSARHALAQRWKVGAETGSEDQLIAGEGDYITAWRLARGHPVAVVARSPRQAALAGAHEETRRSTATLTPLIALALLTVIAGYVLLRRAGKQLVAHQAREIRRFSTLLDALPANVLMFDAAGKAMVANESWRDFARAHMLPMADATRPPDVAEFAAQFDVCPDAAADQGLEGGIRAVLHGTRTGFDGECGCGTGAERRWLHTMVRPFGPASARGAVVLQTDITRRREAEARLRLLDAALDAAANGIVITDTKAVIEWVNPAFTRLTGYTADEAVGHRPAELVKSGCQSPEFYATLWRTILDGREWRGEVVNRHKDGHFFHESLAITPVPDADGAPRHFVAIKEDVTARKATEAALDAARARLATIIANFQEAVLVEDEDRRVVVANQRLCDMFALGVTPQALVGTDGRALSRTGSRLMRDPDAFIARIEVLCEAATTSVNEEILLADGRVLERDFVPITGEAGFLGYFRTYRDVTARKAHEHELQRLATTDPLTGVLNRRAFIERLDLEVLRALRHGRPPALLMLDLDHFKRVNDEWGHAAGDCALRHFAATVSGALRRTDAFGRLGGEEFGLLLPEAGAAGAGEFAERLRALVAATPAFVGAHAIPITMSVGIALCRAAETSGETLLARADEALYRAKAGGRNRVETSA